MLRGPCTRGLDLATEPRRALLLGEEAAALEEDAPGWGASEVSVGSGDWAEERSERHADLLVVSPSAGRPPDELASRLRSMTTTLCVLLTDRTARVDLARAARAAGFLRIELVAPPADAERRFIRFDSTVLLAWTGGAG
jgi:hypothetical protein